MRAPRRSPARTRLDVALVERGLVQSRAKAQALVMARRVTVNQEFVDKPGVTVRPDDAVAVVELEHPWVGRGGMKLAHAIAEFGIALDGARCADIGASTGGFTDVMLANGASQVFSIDVGYGQLDATLRNDRRVVVRERVNARYLELTDFPGPLDFVAVDVSFISLRLILPAVGKILAGNGRLVALIKPQFEVGKGEVGKGGIVRDEAKREAVVEEIVAFARETGFDVRGIVESPVRGAEGNVELLMYAAWHG